MASPNGWYVEFGITRFQKTGQRAFISNGQTYPLGIPLKATITPIEFSFGYRFGAKSSKVIPYVAGGIGRYAYREESDFSADGDNVDVHHVGYLATGGVEFRVQKWIVFASTRTTPHITRNPRRGRRVDGQARPGRATTSPPSSAVDRAANRRRLMIGA